MNINQIDNLNFKAIYRIPYSEQTLKEVGQKVLPVFEKVSNQKSAYFVGRNPFFDGLKIWIDAIAMQNNASAEWLMMNAKNHGGEVEHIEEGFIHIITGEKDIQAVQNYQNERTNATIEKIKKIGKERGTLWYKIKKLFGKEDKPKLAYNENTPEHLKLLFQLIKQNKDETESFNNVFPKIIEIKSTKELFTKMMNER